MASDESDVSAITLSDDDAPKRVTSVKALSVPKATAGAGSSSRANASGTKTAAPAGKSNAKPKSDRGRARVAFQLPEDDGDGEDDAEDGGDANGYTAAGADAAEAGEGPVEDETKPLGWSYFRKRDASEGPASWGEVDVGELRFVAENLVRSTTKRASQADDVMQQIFQAGPVDEDDLVTDPLGRGVIDPVTLTLGKRSKMAKLAPASKGEKGLKATMRTFRTARLTSKQRGGGSDGGAGGSGGGAATTKKGATPDEEARKVLPNQEGFDPEAYLAAFHSESGMGQLEKGLRSLSRELSERTGQLKLLIRNNFDRFINCKDAIDDIHAKMRKMALVRTGPAASGGGAGAGMAAAGPVGAASSGTAAAAANNQGVGTDRVFRSLEQVESQARRTFGPILDRAAKADRIRAVSSLLQRFDNLFACPARILELAGRGELEQVVREYKRANMLIRPTATTARVWVSLYAEIEKRVTEVYLAVKQLVTEPPPEGRPMGQDGPAVLFGVEPSKAASASALLGLPLPGPPGSGAAAGGGAAAGTGLEEQAGQQRLHQLPDYILFLTLVQQERLPAAREEDPMRLYVSRLETHVEARIQACDKQHVDQLLKLVTAWMRATAAGDVRSISVSGPAAGGMSGAPGATAGVARSLPSGIASLQASVSALSAVDAVRGGEGRGAAGPATSSAGAGGKAGGGGGTGDDASDDSDIDGLDDEGEAAEEAFLLWHGGDGTSSQLAATVSAAAAVSAFTGAAKLPYHIRTELPRLVQDPGGNPGGVGVGAQSLAVRAGGGTGDSARRTEPVPVSEHAPEPLLTVGQRQWVSYVCSVSALLLWSLPGLWATANSPKYDNNADLDEQSREGLARGPSLARRLVESLCGKYAVRLRRAAQSLARAGPMQPGLPLIIKDGCHLWTSLRLVGIPSRVLAGLRGAVLAALAAHVGVLEDHLAELPQLLFGADDFRLDILAADQQPVTALPRHLEEEVGVALQHYNWPLRSVLEAAGGVAEVPPECSWRPMQGSVFACFSLLTEALAEYARGLHGGRAGGGGSDGGAGGGGGGSMTRTLSSSTLSESDQPPGELAGAASIRRRTLSSNGTSPHVHHSSRRVLTMDSPGAATGDDDAGGPTAAARASLWSAVGGSSSDDVRMLLVISNSAVIRTRIMPGVVERYRQLLAPIPDATTICQRRLRDLTAAMRRSNEALGSKYLARKEADVQAAVRRYMAAVTAPPLPDAPAVDATTGGVGAVAVTGTAATKRSRSAAAAALLPGPSGPSAGCCALLQLLTAVHNEALAYSPSNLRSFMEALVERLVAELQPACKALLTAGGPGVGTVTPGKSRATDTSASSGASGGVEALVQLWTDLEFLTAALRPLLSKELLGEMAGAQVAVGGAIASRQQARRYRPASAAAAVVVGHTDGESVSGALRDLLTPTIKDWLQRFALNIRCFASATTPAATTISTATAGTGRAGGDAGAIAPGGGGARAAGAAASAAAGDVGMKAAGAATRRGSAELPSRELRERELDSAVRERVRERVRGGASRAASTTAAAAAAPGR